MQLSLIDRTCLVTGGGSGIGKGVAQALVAAGARVMIVGRNPDRLAAAVAHIEATAGDSGGAVRYEPADVTNEEEIARAVEAATAWSGRLHGAVHCAGGIGDDRPAHTDRFGGLAPHCRFERQRDDVRAQACRAGDGARWRRVVRGNLVDRVE